MRAVLGATCLVVAHGDGLVNIVPNRPNLAVPLQFLLRSVLLSILLALLELGLLVDQLGRIFLGLFQRVSKVPVV